MVRAAVLRVLAPWGKRARRANLEAGVMVWMQQAEVRARVATCPVCRPLAEVS